MNMDDKNKDLINEKRREYYDKNKDLINEKRRECAKNKRDIINAQAREYRAKNKDKIKKQSKEYRERYRSENKDKIKEQSKKYKLENQDMIRDINKKYYEKNKEKIKEKSKKYYEKNKETLIDRKLEWYYNNKEQVKETRKLYESKCRAENCDFKIKKNLSRRIRQALSKNKKSNSTEKLIGCTLSFLKLHLEEKFEDGMNWDNYGFKGWHIDHIKPCSLFDLSDPEQQKECFNYTNLQPLWWYDNLEKGNKY